jgi:hypothetical protein
LNRGSAFLLLVSLIINTALTAMSGYFGRWHEIGLVGQPIDMLVSFAVITLLFAMIFKYLPDAIVVWRDVWFGAAVTSICREQIRHRPVSRPQCDCLSLWRGWFACRAAGVALYTRPRFFCSGPTSPRRTRAASEWESFRRPMPSE